MSAIPPLIVTLALDERSFAFFDMQRKRFFPPARNVIPAHLTLFYRLPGQHEVAVIQDLAALANVQEAVSLTVTGLRSLGRGVAYTLSSPETEQMRGRLARKWAPLLTPQDRQTYRPHVTVQNKAEPVEAAALLKSLQAGFVPFAAAGKGLQLWRYLGGPWETVGTFPFSPPECPR